MAIKISLALEDELRPWVDFAAGLEGTSVTAYINGAVRRDMNEAPQEVAEAYEAFKKARTLRDAKEE